MTIKDFAKKVEVSPKTVSRVINNEKYVSIETREKVLRMMKELNYKPNFYARSLRKKIQKNILVSILKNRNSTVPQWIDVLLKDLINEGNELGYTILIETFSYEEEIKKNSILNSSIDFLDGAILFYENKKDLRVKLLKENSIPYIIFDKANDKESSYVTNNDFLAMFDGTEYLISKGITKIDLLLGNKTPTNQERELGSRKAYEKNKIDNKNFRVKYEISQIKDAYDYVKERIISKDLPEAFFVSGDEKVLGVYKALQENNLKIPEDISVMGFDNIPSSEFYHPSLTTIEQNYYKLSQSIFYFFSVKNSGNSKTVIEIETKMIFRESTK